MSFPRSSRRTAKNAEDTASTSSLEKTTSQFSTETLVKYENQNKDAEKAQLATVVANMEEIALKALHVDDDPTLNPWTFRMFFLGR
jgi:hypothetical protein